MRYLTLTMHKDFTKFLPLTPTRTEQKGDFYRLIYWEPLGYFLSPFRVGRLWLTLGEPSSKSWQLVRDLPVAYAEADLLEGLQALEAGQLAYKRQGVGLVLTDWLLEAVCYGIATKQDTARLVRAMFVTGYDMEQVIGVFSTLTRRLDLSGYFLQELTRFYGQEVTV